MVAIMTSTGDRIPDSESIFTAYDKPNPIIDAHQRALGYQTFLREAAAEYEQMDPLILEAIRELDGSCGHKGMPVKILGAVTLMALDHRAVDFSTGRLDPYAVISTEREFKEPVIAESLGYYISPHWPITVTHVARTDTTDAVRSEVFGNVERQNRIHIPIDGNTYVEPAIQIGGVRMELLEFTVPELVSQIVTELSAAKTRTDAIRMLSTIDPAKYPILQTDMEVQHNLSRLIYESLGLKDELIYDISGISNVHVLVGNDTFTHMSLDPPERVAGNITSVLLDFERFDKISLLTRIPFDDNIKRTVVIELSGDTALSPMPTFGVLRK